MLDHVAKILFLPETLGLINIAVAGCLIWYGLKYNTFYNVPSAVTWLVVFIHLIGTFAAISLLLLHIYVLLVHGRILLELIYHLSLSIAFVMVIIEVIKHRRKRKRGRRKLSEIVAEIGGRLRIVPSPT